MNYEAAQYTRSSSLLQWQHNHAGVSPATRKHMKIKTVKNHPSHYVWGIKGPKKVANQYDGYGTKGAPKQGKKK